MAATTPVDPIGDVHFRARVTPTALRTFFRVLDAWHADTITARALLGEPARSTFFQWKRGAGPTLSVDGLTRVSYVLGIYEALQRLLGAAPAQADAWVTRPNGEPLFNGRMPLELMRSGIAGLHAVRTYLDTLTGGPPTRDPTLAGA